MLFSTALGTSDVTGTSRVSNSMLCVELLKWLKFTFLRQSVKICSKLASHKFYLVYMFTCAIYSKKSNFHDSFPSTVHFCSKLIIVFCKASRKKCTVLLQQRQRHLSPHKSDIIH